MLNEGLVHAYCGNGKGKTTAAVGLGIRAAGRGLRVCMIQFLKTRPTGELEVINNLGKQFRAFRLESPKGFTYELNLEQQEKLRCEVRKEFELAGELWPECDVLILDEVLAVVENGFLPVNHLEEFIKNKPENKELVLTGRLLPRSIAELSDYISEINDVKHPARKGFLAREGIEF